MQGTPCSRQPAAKSPRTKAQRRRVCVNTTVSSNQKKEKRTNQGLVNRLSEDLTPSACSIWFVECF
jgi:hypothetical protein